MNEKPKSYPQKQQLKLGKLLKKWSLCNGGNWQRHTSNWETLIHEKIFKAINKKTAVKKMISGYNKIKVGIKKEENFWFSNIWILIYL